MQKTPVFRSRYFWRVFLSFMLVLAVTGLLIDQLMGQRIKGLLTEALQDQLVEASVLLESYASDLMQEPTAPDAATGMQAQELVRELGDKTELRVTLILPDGRVVADSYEDASVMENHGARPEVVAALSEGLGRSQRESKTTNQRMLYLARRIGGAPRAPGSPGAGRDGGADVRGVLRLAIPMRRIEGQLADTRGKLVLSLVLGLLFALILGVVIARRAAAPIVAMTRAAAAIRDGAYDTEVPLVGRRDEVGMLGDTLRDLGAEVTRRIATISEDDEQLRAMLAGMVEGVVAVDDEDRVLFCNGAARRLLGLDLDPRARPLLQQSPLPGLEELLQTARAQRSTARVEIESHDQDTVINAHASPFQTRPRSGKEANELDVERAGLVVVLHDVTHLRRLENIRRDFVANVSHELKTPLAAIKGFVETLLGGAIHDEGNNERFLERIDANVDRLTHLVTDLLSLARIESTDSGTEQIPVDWREVIDAVLHRHQGVAEKKGLMLLSSASDPLVVLGDPEAMTQVLENLVDNAVKYTPEGTVEVTIQEEGGNGVLRVRDTGLGIPPDDIDRIFERFYRVDKARSREVGGTGLGLSIVKHLALSMGGDVKVQSEPGRGTTFAVRLPLAERAERAEPS